MGRTSQSWATVDGNEAVARVAYPLSEVIAIYPITPASPMGELADAWSADRRANLWGSVPEVVELQSEGGAAGTLHGAVHKGALGTTFTASQGLLLMLPNMFKIAGELTPAVMHVAARSIATHALSIFGDHSDVMAARSTGWAMLAASSVQEAHDFALVAHAASLRARVPFLHFFDGFRTSHEIDKIRLLTDDDLRALVDDDDLLAHRMRGLSPDRPVLRGSAQNPDVFFQAREAANPFYDAVPDTVADVMDDLAARTGRRYGLVEYVGAPNAARVIVVMGSAVGAVEETVEQLSQDGHGVGLLKVRLFRPFPSAALAAALPATTRRIAVLDRTKEPGAVGEPLYTDVVAALAEQGRTGVEVIGGRYGLSSKEFTPAMAKGVYDELARERPRRHVTVGIVDDVTRMSIEPDQEFRVPTRAVQAVFYGLGSDGTVGANKFGIKIIGERTDLFAQGYFVYDSRKSGAVTVSHLRFGPEPIRSTYLVDQADFVACHQFVLLDRMKVLDVARVGATFLLNSPYPADETWAHLPVEVQHQILDKNLSCFVIDAHRVARELGLGKRINTVMTPCFFALSGVLPGDQARTALQEAIAQTYGKRGPAVVERNQAAIDRALHALEPLKIPDAVDGERHRMPPLAPEAPDFVHRVTKRMLDGEGDLLPVSALPVDGTFPTGTARWEKRTLAQDLPIWDPSICIDCGKCTIVCPHAALRMKVFDPEILAGAPDGFRSKDYGGRELRGMKLAVQLAPDDCTGCGICVDVCPVLSKDGTGRKSINLESAIEHRDAERPLWDFFERIPEVDRSAVRRDTVKGSQLLQPLFEFSGACSGCGETPYLKLLTQLFGDRLVIANATGCSSIFGGNLPTTPWGLAPSGRGPAWSNSLFEDNAEFGLGLRLAYEQHLADAGRLLREHAPVVGTDLVHEILGADQSDEAGIAAQRTRVESVKLRLAEVDAELDSSARRLLGLADELVRKSFWIVGGDGWAYDIGFGGLDHVLGSGRDVNLLVLDTESYSNTGGQASKATPRGAAAKFATSGKTTAKKDLGAIARAYGDVYVAQIALGANEMQTVRALLEAEAWPGPSLVVAYSTCIAHGIDMATSMTHQKTAVASGYWPLYRYHPSPAGGAHPFQLDMKKPTVALRDFALAESRFSMLARVDPERARHLLALAQADVDERWHYYEQLADEERSMPHDDGGEPLPVSEDPPDDEIAP
ncbi:MAG TPA: pyruvate:ferredoxin (flavodoxin) oxidoreductase [Jiangellaceae bacterium]|nr:pyruvate:ferredoxin (flavodoxin) oxidoreductase [Jiangellaceae bacterium]